MTDTLKVLFQIKPGAATLTDAYVVPALTSATVSTIVVTNQSATPTTYRISVAVAGAVDNAKQYIAYDAPIAANEIWGWTIGATLGAADVVRVYATLATVSFNIFGVEIS